ncbi:Plastocyanin-like domain protein [Quillaja saponaria]|uniref:Plastocyanin-like domain protein n=1 Tax=Quillaja saponaria TaxID=32244 RepID=A0AAD7KW40_QUISA|nr:Plastocyanin-like domain protein [Quillaja saponaria]
MGFKISAGGLLVAMLTATMFAVNMANKNGQFGFNYTDGFSKFGHYHPNKTQNSKKIIVGGSELWRFGFNYTDWAIKNSPFFLNDTLVFKYESPPNNTRPHSVYIFSKLNNFLNCSLTKATMVASVTQGAGQGFEFVLKKSKPYYFACGESNGIHCKLGQMKFSVVPKFRCRYP